MIIGCFALIHPFTPLEAQFKAIRDMGFDYADLTDNHDGASLGAEFNFSATASLDDNPQKLVEMAHLHQLKLTSVCAHANLLDPSSPAVYGTHQIIKAIKLAHMMGIKQVITTEGDPKTPFGHQLSEDQRLFSISEKLYEPIKLAKFLGIELLIEPHGVQSDTVKGMTKILKALGNEDTVGINLDTGNSWLGGGDPFEFVEKLGDRIKHVHWKDMGAEWVAKRGTMFGCGMGSIPLGDGVINIKGIVKELTKIGFNGPTTLEVAGESNVKVSAQRLNDWST